MLDDNLISIIYEYGVVSDSKESWIENADYNINFLKELIEEKSSEGKGELLFFCNPVFHDEHKNYFRTKSEAFYVAKYFADKGFYVEVRGFYINVSPFRFKRCGFCIKLIRWRNISNNLTILEYIGGYKRSGVFYKDKYYK